MTSPPHPTFRILAALALLAGTLAFRAPAAARAAAAPEPAAGSPWPDLCVEGALPSGDEHHPDDRLILTCVPENFNGTLIMYAHGYVDPHSPLALPAEEPGALELALRTLPSPCSAWQRPNTI